jgi:CO dehydrogenase/acetyl-CoA synthase alpha subunit
MLVTLGDGTMIPAKGVCTVNMVTVTGKREVRIHLRGTSCTSERHTRHVVREQVTHGEIKVLYCPTHSSHPANW